jgi:hypothetical protein
MWSGWSGTWSIVFEKERSIETNCFIHDKTKNCAGQNSKWDGVCILPRAGNTCLKVYYLHRASECPCNFFKTVPLCYRY